MYKVVREDCRTNKYREKELGEGEAVWSEVGRENAKLKRKESENWDHEMQVKKGTNLFISFERRFSRVLTRWASRK